MIKCNVCNKEVQRKRSSRALRCTVYVGVGLDVRQSTYKMHLDIIGLGKDMCTLCSNKLRDRLQTAIEATVQELRGGNK